LSFKTLSFAKTAQIRSAAGGQWNAGALAALDPKAIAVIT
jgi:hypothetical protein